MSGGHENELSHNIIMIFKMVMQKSADFKRKFPKKEREIKDEKLKKSKNC